MKYGYSFFFIAACIPVQFFIILSLTNLGKKARVVYLKSSDKKEEFFITQLFNLDLIENEGQSGTYEMNSQLSTL